MINNYGIDVFFRGQHYKIEFPQYWLAMAAGKAIAEDEEAIVFLLERISDNSFDVIKEVHNV